MPIAAAPAPLSPPAQVAAAPQRRFERQLFDEAGFTPIAEIAMERRDVRRLLLSDPYGMLPIPGIEVERVADGAVTLRLQYRGWAAAPVTIDRRAWDEIVARDAALFAPPASAPTTRGNAPSGPPPICHGWIARYEAGYDRTTSWAACGNESRSLPGYDYAVTMIRVAIATRPACGFDPASPFWSFNTCFAAKPALDDPALEARVAPLRHAFDQTPGADRLAEARLALRPALVLGSTEWLAARRAVDAFGALQTQRRDLIQQLRAIMFGTSDLSAADCAKLRETIDRWTQFTAAQDGNQIDLLARLAAAEPPR